MLVNMRENGGKFSIVYCYNLKLPLLVSGDVSNIHLFVASLPSCPKQFSVVIKKIDGEIMRKPFFIDEEKQDRTYNWYKAPVFTKDVETISIERESDWGKGYMMLGGVYIEKWSEEVL
eukprot:gnl/Carplike_NY0171/1788_a2418_923.p1 GENE.gnl/Carplike_NY0171/1788_a2418_923~~gnl/Carplike_NY0171/1788_a2418_923.p1  ORF type:complete len:118 (+),score=32.01 gnl/Carplike_NY0171/1788_a2418_923:206-559(+)